MHFLGIKGFFPFSCALTDYEEANRQVQIAQPYVSWTGFYMVKVTGYLFPITYLSLLCDFGYERYREKTWITDPHKIAWGISKKISDMGLQFMLERDNSNIFKRF